MKGGWLLFPMIASTALLPATAHGWPGSSAFQQYRVVESADSQIHNQSQNLGEARTADSQQRGKDKNLAAQKKERVHPSVKNRPPSHATKTKERPKQPSVSRKHVPSEVAPNSQHSLPGKSGSAARTGVIQEPGARTAARRTPTLVRPNVPLNSTVHHRGANPPVIGGAALASGKGASSINGTTAHRKP
jgi:hypothetical protein